MSTGLFCCWLRVCAPLAFRYLPKIVRIYKFDANTGVRLAQIVVECTTDEELKGGPDVSKQLTFAVVGAGGRGNAYGNFLLRNKPEGQIIAVAEPNAARRKAYGDKHGIAEENRFTSWQELLAQPKFCDALIITTNDRDHYAPTLKALEIGYDILLEKPLSPDPLECLHMADVAENSGRLLSVCHTMRYHHYFNKLKDLLDEGRIGRLHHVQWTENVGYWHQAHSFVRGNWRNTQETSPMLLQKCCHDMDAIQHLVGAKCQRVSSFGSLSYFKPENTPPGATQRCTDGCPAEPNCVYSALKLYNNGPLQGWLRLGGDDNEEARLKALQEGPYGRCVYFCDNDVVDHQVVSMEFEGEVTVAFTMTGLTMDNKRTFKLFGTKGELRGDMEKSEIEINTFDGYRETIKVPTRSGGHGGGDDGIMRSFCRKLRGEETTNQTSALISAQSHLIVFAAEEARLNNTVVSLQEYEARLRDSYRSIG